MAAVVAVGPARDEATCTEYSAGYIIYCRRVQHKGFKSLLIVVSLPKNRLLAFVTPSDS